MTDPQALLNERAILGVFWGAWRARDGNVGNRRNMEKMLELVRRKELSPTISEVCVKYHPYLLHLHRHAPAYLALHMLV
jgi:hypothetical protein